MHPNCSMYRRVRVGQIISKFAEKRGMQLISYSQECGIMGHIAEFLAEAEFSACSAKSADCVPLRSVESCSYNITKERWGWNCCNPVSPSVLRQTYAVF